MWLVRQFNHACCLCQNSRSDNSVILAQESVESIPPTSVATLDKVNGTDPKAAVLAADLQPIAVEVRLSSLNELLTAENVDSGHAGDTSERELPTQEGFYDPLDKLAITYSLSTKVEPSSSAATRDWGCQGSAGSIPEDALLGNDAELRPRRVTKAVSRGFSRGTLGSSSSSDLSGFMSNQSKHSGITPDIMVEDQRLQDHPLMVAYYHGRIMEAHREVKRMECIPRNELWVFDRKVIEQIKRIGAKYEESMDLLNIDVSSLPVHETNAKMKLEWGLQLTDGTLRATFSVERDLDVVKSFVAFQEKDLDVGIKDNLVQVDPLGSPSSNDSIWRVISHAAALGTKGDDIIIESSVDALSEPLGAIWMSGYSPTAQDKRLAQDMENSRRGSNHSHSKVVATMSKRMRTAIRKSRIRIGKITSSGLKTNKVGDDTFNGVRIPKPEKGHNRAANLFFATKVTPLHATGSERLHGFRQTSVVVAKLNPVVYGLISVFPGFMLRKMARGQLEKNILDFERKVRTVELLDERLVAQPRSRFYQSLHAHLSDQPFKELSIDEVFPFSAFSADAFCGHSTDSLASSDFWSAQSTNNPALSMNSLAFLQVSMPVGEMSSNMIEQCMMASANLADQARVLREQAHGKDSDSQRTVPMANQGLEDVSMQWEGRPDLSLEKQAELNAKKCPI